MCIRDRVDYELMTSIKGLFAIGECNFSGHGAIRLGASALMQGLADGYFVLPYTCLLYTSFLNYSFQNQFVETLLRNYTYLNTGLTFIYNGQRIDVYKRQILTSEWIINPYSRADWL